MKRLDSSDSLGAVMSSPNITVDVDDQPNQRNNPNYTREFQPVLEGLDEEGGVEESGHVSEKKRRLSIDQVKALEKNFEVENKLEPERKLKLAQELGLQPRQVAVWFQNRRARWKTKQLERDYGALKANHDALKHNCEALQRDNESLRNEIQELKSKLNEDGNTDNKASGKKEPSMSHNQGKGKLETPDYTLAKGDKIATDLNFKNCDGKQLSEVMPGRGASAFGDFKDGSSDSDSSAIWSEDNSSSPVAAISSKGGILHHRPHQFLDIRGGSSSSSSMNTSFQLSEYDGSENVLGDSHEAYQPQFVKIEEHNFFGEESCSTFFSDDEAPTLHWYCSQERGPEGLNSQIFL